MVGDKGSPGALQSLSEGTRELLAALGDKVSARADEDPVTYACPVCQDKGVKLRVDDQGQRHVSPCRGPNWPTTYCAFGARIARRWVSDRSQPRYQEEKNELLRGGFEGETP